MIVVSILAIVAVAALVSSLWCFILEFLNSTVRDFLERIFGADKCGWYVTFLQWADKKTAAAHRVVKDYWRRFKDTIVKVKSRYHKNDDGTYAKKTETVVRTAPASGRRVVVEETVGWEYLPDSVRTEMVRLRTNDAELDDKAVVEERVRTRAREELIELSA